MARRNVGFGLAIAFVLVAGTAAAEPLSVWVGQKKTMTLSVQVASASVDDGSVLSVRKAGRGIELSGVSVGRTTLHVRTHGGDEFDFPVHVVPSGTKVYSLSRGDSSVPSVARATASLRPASGARARSASSSTTASR